MRPFVASIENLIRENRIKLALSIVADFLRGKNEEMYNRCLLLQSNLKQTEQDYLGNILNHDTALQHLARTRQALINLLSEVGQQTFDDAAAIARANEVYKEFQDKELIIKPAKSGSPIWWWVAGIVAIAAAVYFTRNSSASPDNPPAQKIAELSVTEKLEKVKALRSEANRYAKQKDYKKAIVLQDEAVELSPDNADLYNERADTRFMLGQIDLAYDDVQRAIVLAPSNATAYGTLAQIATKRNDSDGFYTNFEKALQKGWNGWDFQNVPGIVEHKNESRFQRLLDAYRSK